MCRSLSVPTIEPAFLNLVVASEAPSTTVPTRPRRGSKRGAGAGGRAAADAPAAPMARAETVLGNLKQVGGAETQATW